MKKYKEFEIDGVKYTIEYKKEIVVDDKGVYGTVTYPTSTIALVETMQGHKVNQDVTDWTMYHEIAHIMLNNIGIDIPETSIERLAERLGSMLLQMNKTLK